MNLSIRVVLVSTVLAGMAVHAAAEMPAVPAGVSPGAVDRFSTIRDECPTFSWEAIEGTALYELAAYEIAEQQLSVDSTVELSESQEVLYSRVPGGATSWTPELDQCLVSGERYVWFVRAVFDEADGVVLDAGEWSDGLWFSVAAAPSVEEVEQALQVLQRYLDEGGSGGLPLEPRPAAREETRRGSRRHGSGILKSMERSVLSAPAAIRGTMPDPTGEFYGVVGISSSPQGAGVAVANTAGGADLVLDGSVQGTANTEIRESGIDRRSSGPQTFDITNSGAGDMRLRVDGVEVVTTDTDQDTLGGLQCAGDEVAKWNGSSWLCADDENDGLTLPFEDSAPTAGATFKINNTSTSGNVFAVSGHNESIAGAGVFGWSTAQIGFTSGVVGQSSSGVGTGVFGVVDHTSGANYGVGGISSSTNGTGVAGYATATSGNTKGVYGESASDEGFGVHGHSASGGGWIAGVYGTATGSDSAGVKGYNTCTNCSHTRGVYGRADSDSGVGVYGRAGSSAGTGHGVFGTTSSLDGVGVRGQTFSPSGDNIGVWGITASASGIGVYGRASALMGTPYGVYGYTVSSSGYAGYFDGRAHVTGHLSKASGSFKIDHPLDPANMFLYHSFVESPDMMNIYNGNAILDERGEAWVKLPEWFEALNRDFRYQLTCIGGHAPVYIAEEIEGNLFKIGGGSPGMKVSWQLTGVRQDAWAEAHRIPVEEDKAGDEVGLYLHPEERGQPRELGISWRRIQHVEFPDPRD